MTTIPHRLRHAYHGSLVSFKRLYYGNGGEPIRYGKHNLRYVPGTRPVRLKYVNSLNGTVRYDAKQTVMVISNTGDKAITPSWDHYSERANGFTQLKDVVSGNSTSLKGFEIKPKESFVFELVK